MGKKKSNGFQLTFDTAELPQSGDDLLDDIDRLLAQQRKKRQEGSAEENGAAARNTLSEENAQADGADTNRAQADCAGEEKAPTEAAGAKSLEDAMEAGIEKCAGNKEARYIIRDRAANRGEADKDVFFDRPDDCADNSARQTDKERSAHGKVSAEKAEETEKEEETKTAAGREEPQIQIDRNELLRKQRVAMFTKPEMLLETPYTVTVNNRQYVRYRLEYGNPDKEIPPEIASSAGILIPPIDRGDEQAAIKQRRKQKCANAGREIAGWVLTLAFAALLALLINSFVFFFARVEGSSMLGTLKDGEVLFVWRAGYVFGQPQRGDIVICHYPKTKDGGYLDQKNTCYVKRVIGLPGDTVSIRQGTVYINGEALKESYLETERIDSQSMEAVVLEEGEYFLMGDNRSDSTDSRRMGAVERGKILGKAVGVVYPFTEFGSPYANMAG